AQEWVDAEKVLPLIDGLDEVKAENRTACVEAINAYRQEHGFLPLVISSRTADYEALSEPLRLHGAIVVRPLSHEQIELYLAQIGTSSEAVLQVIHDAPTFWELLDTPLMLSIVAIAYMGTSDLSLPKEGTRKELRDQVLGAYVDQMFRRRRAERHYTREQTVHWLGWLA